MNNLPAKIVISVTMSTAMAGVAGQEYNSQFLEDTLSISSDGIVIVAPGRDIYRAGKFKTFWFGDNYREEWLTPVKAPVFDFRNGNGKLEIIDTGGGFQTRSLRLRDELGKEWVLRSIDKNPSPAIPDILKTDFAEDIVQDQISASHPYGALSVPAIAEAAGIYHTNPGLVYLHGDSVPARWGKHWEGLYLLEERPDDNRDDVASFGYSQKIISTSRLLEKVTEDQESHVDQPQYLRSRLVDMLISDWDRHEDQWRWAAFKDDGETLYRPVPRDRDMAFFVTEGILPWLSTRRFLLRKIQGLDYDIKDLKGLNIQARHLDRRFLNELTWNDWKTISLALKSSLTDTVIDRALNDMPQGIVDVKRDVIASKIKARRDHLDKTANEYYSILSEKTDVVGTDKSDYFKVDRISNSETKVTVYDANRDNQPGRLFYERSFNHSETREIMLYGQDGNDLFHVEGEVRKGIKIHIVSGKGKDSITDSSGVSGISRKTFIYDDPAKTSVISSGETRLVASGIPGKYSYNYDLFNYDKLIPFIYPGYNTGEGGSLAAGFALTTYDFLRKPFAAKHNVSFEYSTATGAKEFNYNGKYTDMFNLMNMSLKFHFRDPKFTQNYFGAGNETEKTSPDKDYYRVRIGEMYINPELSHAFSPRSNFSAGIFYQRTRIEATPGRFISELQANGLDPEVFEPKEYTGLSAGFSFDSRNNTVYPTAGVYLAARNEFYYGLREKDHRFNRITGEARLFLNPRGSSWHIAAFRLGGAMNTGDYGFYQLNTVGGQYNLRGLPYSRYSGFAAIYQNTELRIKLSRVKSYITRGYFGLVFFNDIGRVWHKGEISHRWHHGYGGGIWVSPYEVAIINALLEFSPDENKGLISVRFGFFF